MDILNFISWTKNGRTVNTVDAAHTLLPLGLRDPKRDDGYLAGAITVTDFLALVPTSLPSYIEYNDTNKTLWNNGSGNMTGNTTFGQLALAANTSGNLNTAVGYASLFKNTSGTNNTAIGSNALDSNIIGDNNTAVGTYALQLTVSSGNAALGSQALRANVSGVYNTAVGADAASGISSGTNNTALGASAMTGSTSGDYNTIVGNNATNSNFSSCVVLGAEAAATANNQFVVGTAARNAGLVATETNTSTKVWNVIINGVAQKILLA